MSDGPTPDPDAPEEQEEGWLRERLHRQATDIVLPRPDEVHLHQRTRVRRRRKLGTAGAAVAIVAGSFGFGAAQLIDDGGTSRVQVASPDNGSSADEESADEGARDRRGSGLTFSPLPLETAPVALPEGADAWTLFVDGDALYVSTNGWLQRTTDLRRWTPVPRPPLAELLADGTSPIPNDGAAAFEQALVEGDVIAAVAVTPAAGVDAPQTPCDPSSPRQTPTRHIVVSRDGGASWTASTLPSPTSSSSSHDQTVTIASDGSSVVVATTSFDRATIECLLIDRGILDVDELPASMGFRDAIEFSLADGSELLITPDDLGMTSEELFELLDDVDDAPTVVSSVEPNGSVVERLRRQTYLALAATPAGYLVAPDGDVDASGARSLDGGVTWIETEVPGWLESSQNAHGVLYATDIDALLRTDDLGATWEVATHPPQLTPELIARGPAGVLVLGHEPMADPLDSIPLEVSFTADGRTLNLRTIGGIITLTVVDDESGAMLFSASAGADGEPPEGVLETEDSLQVHLDGEILFEVGEEELARAYGQAMDDAFEAGGIGDGEYEAPSAVIAFGDQGHWDVALLSDIAGDEAWALVAEPWGDQFLLVVHAVPWFDGPRLLLLTPR